MVWPVRTGTYDTGYCCVHGMTCLCPALVETTSRQHTRRYSNHTSQDPSSPCLLCLWVCVWTCIINWDSKGFFELLLLLFTHPSSPIIHQVNINLESCCSAFSLRSVYFLFFFFFRLNGNREASSWASELLFVSHCEICRHESSMLLFSIFWRARECSPHFMLTFHIFITIPQRSFRSYPELYWWR